MTRKGRLRPLFAPRLLALALGLAPALRAGADAVLLKDGNSVEGTIVEKGGELEVATAQGSVWVDKAQVKRRFGPVSDVIAQATKEQQRGRSLFDEAGKLDKADARLAKLRDALKVLEATRDSVMEAQEAFSSPMSADRIREYFLTVLQDVRLCRYNVRELESQTAPPPPAAAAVAAAPQPAKPPGGPAPAPATANGTAGGSRPPSVAGGGDSSPDPGPSRPLDSARGEPVAAPTPVPSASPQNDPAVASYLQQAREILARGDVDAAYAKYQQVVREGGDAGALRGELAKALYERAMKAKPPAVADLRRALDLDPAATACADAYMEACFTDGRESFIKARWNNSTVQFTQAIRAATDLLGKAEKAKYYNWRGMAYQYRAIAEHKKFGGLTGHKQIVPDFTKAGEDYRAALNLDPNGPNAASMRSDLEYILDTLNKLNNPPPRAAPQPVPRRRR